MWVKYQSSRDPGECWELILVPPSRLHGSSPADSLETSLQTWEPEEQPEWQNRDRHCPLGQLLKYLEEKDTIQEYWWNTCLCKFEIIYLRVSFNLWKQIPDSNNHIIGFKTHNIHPWPAHSIKYRVNRSTEYVITAALLTTPTHPDQKGIYMRILFIDYSSAFNTIIQPVTDSYTQSTSLLQSVHPKAIVL